MPRLQTNFADGADSGNTGLLSFLLAGGPLRAPFSDGAVLTWLKARGVDPLTAACTAEGEQVDGLSGSHVRMALEALKVSTSYINNCRYENLNASISLPAFLPLQGLVKLWNAHKSCACCSRSLAESCSACFEPTFTQLIAQQYAGL